MAEIIWDDFEDEVSVEDVKKIEEELHVQFPEDFVSIARMYNGGYPDKILFQVVSRGEAVFDRLLSFHEESPIYILDIFHAMQDRLPKDVFPFAEDPFGNSVCFDYRSSSTPKIVFWDHERAFEDVEKGLFPVCNSFREFLSSLYEDEEV